MFVRLCSLIINGITSIHNDIYRRLTDIITCKSVAPVNKDGPLKMLMAPYKHLDASSLNFTCLDCTRAETMLIAAAEFHQPDRVILTASPLPASTIILLNNAEPSLLLLPHSVILSVHEQQQHHTHPAMPSTC